MRAERTSTVSATKVAAKAATKATPVPVPPNKKRGADETLVQARLRELFPAAATKAEARQRGDREVAGSFKMLSHERITVRPQVRRTFPQTEMDELRASIREIRAQAGGIEATGILQALLVSPLNEESGGAIGYRLIAGEKRFRATRDEALPEVPCIVVPAASESLIRLMQLTENALRTPPPVIEEALAIRETVDELKLSLRDMARMLGKSLGFVTERLSLLKMDSDVQQMVSARPNTLRHARLIDPIQNHIQRAELIAAALDGAGEREIRRRIEDTTGKGTTGKGANGEGTTGADETERSGQQSDTAAENHTNHQGDHSTNAEVFARANSNGTRTSTDGELTGGEVGGGEVSDGGARGTGISIHHRSLPNAEEHPDPLAQTMQPAAAFLAEARRQLQGLPLSADYKRRLREAVASMQEQLTQIEELTR